MITARITKHVGRAAEDAMDSIGEEWPALMYILSRVAFCIALFVASDFRAAFPGPSRVLAFLLGVVICPLAMSFYALDVAPHLPMDAPHVFWLLAWACADFMWGNFTYRQFRHWEGDPRAVIVRLDEDDLAFVHSEMDRLTSRDERKPSVHECVQQMVKSGIALARARSSEPDSR